MGLCKYLVRKLTANKYSNSTTSKPTPGKKKVRKRRLNATNQQIQLGITSESSSKQIQTDYQRDGLQNSKGARLDHERQQLKTNTDGLPRGLNEREMFQNSKHAYLRVTSEST